MHTHVAHRVHTTVIVAIILSFLLPLGSPTSVAAEGEECPEGLVYLVEEDLCVLPEDVPPDAEFIDQHADDAIDSEEEPSDPADDETTDLAEDETTDLADDEATDLAEDETADLAEDGAIDLTEDDAEQDDAEPGDDVLDDEPADVGTIKNITVLTFSCPINWDPATRLLVDSKEICTVIPVGGVTYSVLQDGLEVTSANVGAVIDLAQDAGASVLEPGLWSIQESASDALADPFAFCAIFDADGTQRMEVRESVPGGKLDILLAADEEVTCEWYSVAEVPEVVGDPNALPIGSLELVAASCPYKTSEGTTLEALVALCTDKGVAPVTYTASSGTIVSTQIGPTDSFDVDFQTGQDARLLSGTWRISADLPPEYDETYIYCTVTSEVGAVTDIEPETFFNQIDLELLPGDAAFCRWFNVESEPRIGPSLGITLLLNVCPDGFDPDAGDYNTCNLPLPEPITFDFIHNGQVVETITATAPETSMQVKSNGGLPESGEWTLRPTLWENREEPGWSCSANDASGTNSTYIDYFDPEDGLPGISAKFGPNHRLECNAWLYTTVFTESASVQLFTCPDDFDPASSTDADRKAACPPENSGYRVTFAVDGAEAGTDRGNAIGRATSPVAPGLNRISVESGQTQVTGFVVCDHTRTDLNQIQTIEVPINSDKSSITIELDVNDELACEWFLVPGTPVVTEAEDTIAEEPAEDDMSGADDTTDMTDMDDMTDMSTSDDMTDTSGTDDTTDTSGGDGMTDTSGIDDTTDMSDSDDSTDGSFGGGSGASDDTDASGGTSDDGSDGSSGGGGSESNDKDSSLDANDADGVEEPVESTDDDMTSGTDDDSDQPNGDLTGAQISNLTIQKWTCEIAAVAGASYDDLTRECTPANDPSAWQLNGVAFESENGQMIWDDPEPGSLIVSLESTAGDSQTAVYCTVEPIGELSLEQQSFPVANGEIQISATTPSDIYCNWFVHE